MPEWLVKMNGDRPEFREVVVRSYYLLTSRPLIIITRHYHVCVDELHFFFFLSPTSRAAFLALAGRQSTAAPRHQTCFEALKLGSSARLGQASSSSQRCGVGELGESALARCANNLLLCLFQSWSERRA